jgi:tetratricopeptide (TPR) repeat protein
LLAIEDSYGGKPGDAERRSHESVEIARGLNDPRLLLDVLEARYQAIHVPQHLDERVAIVEERRRLTGRVSEDRSAWVTAQHGYQAALENCRIDDADPCLADEIRLAEKLGDPYASWITSMHRYSRAILAGHIHEAERLAEATHHLGQEAGRPDADAVYAGQLFFVLLYLGRVGELVGLLEAAADDFPHIQAFQSGLVTAYCEVGEFEKAAVRLDKQLRRSFSEAIPDITWLGALTQFGHVAATVGHRSAAERLFELLTPFETQLAYSGAVVFDVVAASLARLAHLLDAKKESRLWFHQAQELTHALGAPLLRALTQIYDAELLIADNGSEVGTGVADLVPEWRRLAAEYDCLLVSARAEKLLGGVT